MGGLLNFFLLILMHNQTRDIIFNRLSRCTARGLVLGSQGLVPLMLKLVSLMYLLNVPVYFCFILFSLRRWTIQQPFKSCLASLGCLSLISISSYVVEGTKETGNIYLTLYSVSFKDPCIGHLHHHLYPNIQ